MRRFLFSVLLGILLTPFAGVFETALRLGWFWITSPWQHNTKQMASGKLVAASQLSRRWRDML
jgi:hypothetical protein